VVKSRIDLAKVFLVIEGDKLICGKEEQKN
jgi:hypothetical protein